jgi:hypothetical protein
MFRKRGFLSVSLYNILIMSLILWPCPLTIKEIMAQEVSPIYIGHAMATGKAFLVYGSGEQLRMDAYDMPIFDKSRIQTGEGAVVISLVPNGLIEVNKDTEILLSKNRGKNILKIIRGIIRFSIPSQDTLSIITPSVKVSIRGQLRLAGIKTTSLPIDGGEMVGIAWVEEGGMIFISSTKDSLAVSTDDGRVQILRPGEVIRLAQAETASEGKPEGGIRKVLTSKKWRRNVGLIIIGVLLASPVVAFTAVSGGDDKVASPSQ